MKLPARLQRRLHWLNLPSAILMLLLQRMPALSALIATDEMVIASPSGVVLKSLAATAAALGAVNSMAGATPLSPSSGTETDLAVAAGATVNVFYTVTGTATPPQSWTVSGQIPPGLNFSGLAAPGTINVGTLNLRGTPTTAGTYTLTLRAFEFVNATGIASPVYNYTITVTGNTPPPADAAPVITTQPSGQPNMPPGSSIILSVRATGNPPPTYQWRKDGNAIAGATTPDLAVNNVTANDAGTYTVVVTNSAGSVISEPAVLSVAAANSAPAITTQPADQSTTVGGSVTFTVAATGNPAPTYQWKKGGTDIVNATNASLTLANVTANDAGTYTVVVANSAGSVTSNAATLTVNAAPAAPAFTTQPAGKTAALGTSATFTAAASGNPTPTFQWKKGGVDIAGATSSSFTIGSVGAADAGTYTVVATNASGSATSDAATLTVSTPAPTQVANVKVTTGHDATFSAGNVSGSLQWQVSTNGGATWTDLTNSGPYSGVHSSQLRVTNVTSESGNAQYRYVLTNNGVVSFSNAASATVMPAFFPSPMGITIATTTLFVSDFSTNTIKKVTSNGQVSLLAGAEGTAGSADGRGSAARFNHPGGLVLLASGEIKVADAGNATLRSITSDGTVTTVAGQADLRGGNDGTGTAAMFSEPLSIAAAKDGSGTLYIADALNHTIRKVTSAGVVTTIAGSAGTLGFANGNGSAARFNFPDGVAVDNAGNVYVSDRNNNTIRKITPAGDVTTLAGLESVTGFDDGTGRQALFNHPAGMVLDSRGNLLVADSGNSTIRKITPAGEVTTLAGTPGVTGLLDGTGTNALLNQPSELAIDAADNLFVADSGNAAIRKITPAGEVTTLALSESTVPPPPAPAPAPTPPPAPGGGGSGGGGGGAASPWFLGTLALLGLGRRFLTRKAAASH